MSTDKRPLRPVQIVLPQELYRRAEREKSRTGTSLNKLLVGYLMPHLLALPAEAPGARIES